jgi:ABC-type Fe3+ transport system permease subunit
MNCPYYQADNSHFSQYCSQCGKDFNKAITCSNCEQLSSSGSKCCTSCGALLVLEIGKNELRGRNAVTSLNNRQWSQPASKLKEQEKVKPPYGWAILLIVLGIVTATVVPSIVGVVMLIKCTRSTGADRHGDHNEAKKLAHQAIWNPLGLSKTAMWIIGLAGLAVAIIGLLIFLLQ